MENTNTMSPAYKANEFQSEVSFCHTLDLNDVAKYLHTGWMLLWQHHNVFLIEVIEGKFKVPEEMHEDTKNHLQRLCGFNNEKEWNIWRSNNGFRGRKREDQPKSGDKDAKATTIEAIDVNVPLRAVIALQMPKDDHKVTWVLEKRSYILYNEFNLAYYADQRFVSITKIGKESQS